MKQLVSVALIVASAAVMSLLPHLVLAESGTIEFSDQAPAPSKKQVELGQAWSKRVGVLADQITRLATCLQATVLLRDSLAVAGQPTSSQLTKIRPLIGSWKTSQADLFKVSQGAVSATNPETFYGEVPASQPMWSFNLDALAPYIKATITLVGQVKSIPKDSGKPFSVDGLPQLVASVLDNQSNWFDELVAEHGILNERIRYHPYQQTQTPVPCETINKFSKRIKCTEASANGAIGDQRWVFGMAQLDSYCLAKNAQSYSADESVHLSIRAEKELGENPAFPQLIEARVSNPLSGKQLGLQCQ